MATEQVSRHALEDLSARVLDSIHAVTQAHNLLLGSDHLVEKAWNIVRRVDLAEHMQNALVGSAVERSRQ